MKISIICSDHNHPVYPYLARWKTKHEKRHTIELIKDKKSAQGGDILFLISCNQIITAEDRARYGSSLVLHASDLPRGRGWSPHIWEISKGSECITLTLLDAADKVDSGNIWKKQQIQIPKHALWNEINHILFEAELELMDFAINAIHKILPTPQSDGLEASYHPRRTSKDSEVDPAKSILAQFDLLRVCDPNRFPAYFDHLGHRYTIKLEKINEK